jgi:hypothetical protein
MEVNVTNILDVPALDLALWAVNNLLNVQIPQPGPNHTLNVQGEIVPVLSQLANKQLLATELYVIVVGATPTQTSVRSSGGSDVKMTAEVLSRKKDILYRVIQTLEAARETASRMITGAQIPRNPF